MTLPTILTLLALGILAVTLVAVGVPLIARLRAQESQLGDPTAPGSDASLSAINELGQRIETLVSQQQEQGETQRQRLAQQIDTVQQTVGEQRVLVDGLRSEMRHEVQRRDHEMDEIRTQIASIQQALPALTAASSLALPPATAETAPASPEATEPQTDAVVEDVDPFALDPLEAPEPDALATSASDVTLEADTWTADWTEADLPDATFDDMDFEDMPFDEMSFEDVTERAAPAEAPAVEADVAAEATDQDVFADVSTFEVAPTPIEVSPIHAPSEPEAASPADDLFVDASPTDIPEAAPPAEESSDDALVFDELEVAEMSFVDPTPDPYAFDPDEAAREIDAIEASLASILPGPPISEMTEATVFTDALPNEPALPEADPFSVEEIASEPEGPTAPPAEDTFTPTPFLEDAVPTADPLAFEETFVPTPVESAAAEGDSGDVFASWSPSSFEPAAPEPPLAFTEAPAEAPEETAPVDLSSFEDWGLDPEPAVEAPQTSWAPAEPTFEAWAPAPHTPTPQATPQAPAAPAPAVEPPASPEAPSATAWVVRNENLEPTAPPAAEATPNPTPIADDIPLYEEMPAFEEAPAYEEASVFEEAPAFEATPASSHQPAPAQTTPAHATPIAPPSVSTAPSFTEPTPETAPGSAPAPLPEGAERLSVLPSIDNDLERALYIAGVLTLDEMARWGRTDARRIAGQVGVSEETVLDRWVFEAQTALFERFTQQVGS